MITFTAAIALVLVALFVVSVDYGLIGLGLVVVALLIPWVRRFLTSRTQSATYLVRR
ncbi:MAG: hypothetical protein OEW30_13990 [Acidimicrobiia bacterium]|nr:hypothetical protein [Acidimicrobiia bacterium]MDH5292937.1 hypothetical protein [Acidimicrobiia bacterium]